MKEPKKLIFAYNSHRRGVCILLEIVLSIPQKSTKCLFQFKTFFFLVFLTYDPGHRLIRLVFAFEP